MREPVVGERVFFRDGFGRDVAEEVEQGDYDACAVLACCAMYDARGRVGRRDV